MATSKQKLATIVANGEFVSGTTKDLLNTLMGDIAGDLKYLLYKLFKESEKNLVRISPMNIIYKGEKVTLVGVMVSPIPNELLILYTGENDNDTNYIPNILSLNAFDLSNVYDRVVDTLKKEL